jgi:hypothetical protein
VGWQTSEEESTQQQTGVYQQQQNYEECKGVNINVI